jgi:hypothetical protein
MSSYGQAQSIGYEESAKFPQKKTKKLGFFKRWLLGSLKDAAATERETDQYVNMTSTAIRKDEATLDRDRGMRFSVYSASGGRVIETVRYDRQKDRSISGLHIITNEQDFGREIDKIFTMENLRG